MMTYAISCQSSERKSYASSDSLVVETVSKFYQWYINEAYPKSTSHYQVPGYKKLNETTYVFDLEEYRRRINTIDYFSEGYKEKLYDRLKNCNLEMQKVKWEYEPEPMFNIDACNYLWGNLWVGGQGEKITGFKIDKVAENDKQAEVIVLILIGDKVFVRSKALLSKIGREYKIEDIALVWD